jgi:hypothetical protein
MTLHPTISTVVPFMDPNLSRDPILSRDAMPDKCLCICCRRTGHMCSPYPMERNYTPEDVKDLKQQLADLSIALRRAKGLSGRDHACVMKRYTPDFELVGVGLLGPFFFVYTVLWLVASVFVLGIGSFSCGCPDCTSGRSTGEGASAWGRLRARFRPSLPSPVRRRRLSDPEETEPACMTVDCTSCPKHQKEEEYMPRNPPPAYTESVSTVSPTSPASVQSFTDSQGLDQSLR